MKKRKTPNFTQHLYLMGDRFDEQITQWFKGSIIIEHDLDAIRSNDKLAILKQICSVTMGHKITKVTEVIGGSPKGLMFARLSGAYPIAITQNSGREKGLLTRLVDVVTVLRDLHRVNSVYSDCLSELRHCTHGLKGVSVAKMRELHDAIEQHAEEFDKLIDSGVGQNFRRLLV